MIMGNEELTQIDPNFIWVFSQTHMKLLLIWVWEKFVDLEKSYNNDRKALRQGHYCTNNITKRMC
jgi:hypothetical protein